MYVKGRNIKYTTSGKPNQKHLLMNPPPTADEEPLLNATKSALKSTTIPTLRGFCLKYNLVVAASGKRGQAIKEDYVGSILSYVSGLVKGRHKMH